MGEIPLNHVGYFYVKATFHGGIFSWVKEFFMEGEARFLGVIKSDQKLNYKKVSSPESKEQRQTLKG